MSIRDDIATADAPTLASALGSILALVDEANHGRQSRGALYGKLTAYQIIDAITVALDADSGDSA